MSDFIKLNRTHKKIYNEYINNNFLDNIYLAIDFSEDTVNIKNDKKSGDYYGFFKNNKLLGVFVFSNSRILHMSFLDDEVLIKVDLLRAIKHYKPIVIKGNKTQVRKLLKIIDRSILSKKENHFNVMEYVGHGFNEEIITDTLTDNILNNSNEFIVSVEQEFGRNPKLLNVLKSKIENKYLKREYFLYSDSGKIISQGMLENVGDGYIIIGAIFTAYRFRKKGLATKIVKAMTNEVLSRKKVPLLLVNESNENAIDLYSNLNFKLISKFYIVEIKIK